MEPFVQGRDLKHILEYLFKIYDTNSDGIITKEEIHLILDSWCTIIV